MASIKGSITREYLARFPNTPTRTLTQKIYDENKDVFKDYESARRTVRYYRGQSGQRDKDILQSKDFVKTGKINPFDDLPDGIKCMDEAKYYNVTGKRVLVLSDVHIPYHVKEPLQIALQYGLDVNIDTIVLLGDFWDCYHQSTFDRDPRKRSTQKELETVNQVLGMMRKMFPQAKIIYKLGNHEDRWERWLKVKAPELLDMEIVSFDSLLKTDLHGIEIIRKGTIVKIGHLNLIHGHELGRSVFSPVNAARGVFLRGHECCMLGHYHQSSNHTETTMNDKVIACWSVGCLCDLRPEYKPINIKWQHGFAIVDRDGDNFVVQNKKIIKGQIF